MTMAENSTTVTGLVKVYTAFVSQVDLSPLLCHWLKFTCMPLIKIDERILAEETDNILTVTD